MEYFSVRWKADCNFRIRCPYPLDDPSGAAMVLERKQTRSVGEWWLSGVV